MKKKISLLIVSIVFISLIAVIIKYYFYMNERNPHNDIYKVSNIELQDIKKILDNIAITNALFEERYYAYLIAKVKNSDEIEPIKFTPFGNTLDQKTFSSSTIYDELTRLTDYYNNIMKLKIAIADNNFDVRNYTKYYNAIEFHYLSAEASLELIKNSLEIDDEQIFLPDVITQSVMKSNKCFKATVADGYEATIRWFMENSSIRASFDKEFFKVLFGRNIYNQYQINQIYKKMKSIYLVFPNCEIPIIFGDIISDSEYENIITAYKNKLDLVELVATTNTVNENDIIDRINKIYNAKSFNDILSNGLGVTSFQTLGDVAIFELYSKSQDNSTDIQNLPDH